MKKVDSKLSRLNARQAASGEASATKPLPEMELKFASSRFSAAC